LPPARWRRIANLAGADCGRHGPFRQHHRRPSHLACTRWQLQAPIADPRRAMGELLGNGVRLGAVKDVLAAGEGIETMLSLKSLLPQMPMVAALSAAHLAALLRPQLLRRLYVAVDNDPAGHRAATRLTIRARSADVESLLLMPHRDDWNTDLRTLGPRELLADLAVGSPTRMPRASPAEIPPKPDGIPAAPKLRVVPQA